MRLLWITNIPFDYHNDLLGLDSPTITSGSWLYAAFEAIKRCNDIQLHVATVSNVKEFRSGTKDGHSFYILPGDSRGRYNINSSRHIAEWELLRDLVSPDAVIVWGTEKRFSFLAMRVFQGLPIAIYMQGIIYSIYRSYYDGIPHRYKYYTPRDFIDRINPYSTINSFKHQVFLEHEMLGMATGVIIENDWCEDICKSINNNLSIYRNPLPIRDAFRQKQWSINGFKRHTIFTNAGGYPIKGHHILLEAIGIVKRRYPDVLCYIPGPQIDFYKSKKRRTGYIQYLLDLIKKNDIENNVVYTGKLDCDQMVDYLTTANVYVMPSIMENHSSSLIEAMYVGSPCISSLVGGTASLVRHKINGLLYNSLDAISLAGSIIRIFEDDALAMSLSKEALKIRDERQCDFGKDIVDICHLMISYR